jgi:hypothetical protein
MPSKAELTQLLDELEEEYRFWMVEAIALDRGVENLEEKIDQHADEIGVDRVAEFRLRLRRTRDRHEWIENRLLTVRQRLNELKLRLSQE